MPLDTDTRKAISCIPLQATGLLECKFRDPHRKRTLFSEDKVLEHVSAAYSRVIGQTSLSSTEMRDYLTAYQVCDKPPMTPDPSLTLVHSHS